MTATVTRLSQELQAAQARLADLDVAMRVLASLDGAPEPSERQAAPPAPGGPAPSRVPGPAAPDAAGGRPAYEDKARPRLLALVASDPGRWWTSADFTAALPDRHRERIRQLAYQLVKSGHFIKDDRGRFQWAGAEMP